MPGTYQALLATTTASASSRFNLSGLPWARTDGVLIAATAADFFSTTALWDSAPNTAANGGANFGNYGSWGGATSPTAPATAATSCASWTSTTGNGSGGRTGFSRMADLFARAPTNACNVGHMRLTCLQE